MKFHKLCIVFLLFISSILPISGSVNKSIIILSKQLPYIMYVEVVDEKHMNVNFIPRDMKLPITCERNKPLILKSINPYKERECISNSVEKFFEVRAKHYVYIHLDRIAKTLELPYKNLDFHKISTITDYFANVVKKLKISMLLHYSDYIESDLGVSDYYDYYNMFKGKRVRIDYYHVNQLVMKEYTLPLDHRFHKVKASKK